MATLVAIGMGAPNASATETKTFGGNPAGEVDTQINCEYGAPPYFHGAETSYTQKLWMRVKGKAAYLPG
jgi:hypothetical protein